MGMDVVDTGEGIPTGETVRVCVAEGIGLENGVGVEGCAAGAEGEAHPSTQKANPTIAQK